MALPALIRRMLPTATGTVVDTATINPSVGEQLRSAQGQVERLWRLAVLRSAEYAQALDMTARDIDSLSHLEGAVVVSTETEEMLLVPKNTCGSPYGDTWRTLLQPRDRHRMLNGIGGGTTYFTILRPETHEAVLKAIRSGATRLVNESIWP